jgi:hypothetical protein
VKHLFDEERREDRMTISLARLVVAVAVFGVGASVHAAVRLWVPLQDPGPPFYAAIDRPPTGQIFHDGEWAAIPFVRDPACVPADVNLLDGFDLPPRPFRCGLTVHGFVIYKNGPDDLLPIHALLMGNGAVPIWFMRWSELQTAIDDDVLTITELETLPSLLVGSASFFEYLQQPGAFRPQGFGNGKIESVASGTLSDGRGFQFSVREVGVDQISTLRHIRIQFL